MRVEPKKIIQLFKKTKDIDTIVQTLGIHRATVYRWIMRAKVGWSDLRYLQTNVSRKSTRPEAAEVFKIYGMDGSQIAELRRKHSYCAEKIKHILKLPYSISTIHRYLKRRGYIRSDGYHRRPRLQPTIHMHAKNVKQLGYLQMDVKYITPQLSGLPWTCFEYGVIDIFSRYKEARILNQLDQDGAILALQDILSHLPCKAHFVQTDNGLEFQGRFDSFCERIGLEHHYVHKRSPNENAVIERSFRTDEEEFFFFLGKPLTDYDDLRERFANYLHYYNYERPHFGINLDIPAKFVAKLVTE